MRNFRATIASMRSTGALFLVLASCSAPVLPTAETRGEPAAPDESTADDNAVAAAVTDAAAEQRVGHWLLDEGSGTVAADSGNPGVPGLINGPVTWVRGRLRDAYAIELGRAATLTLAEPGMVLGAKWSIGVWFLPSHVSEGALFQTLTQAAGSAACPTGDRHVVLMDDELGVFLSCSEDAQGFHGSGFHMATLEPVWHHLLVTGVEGRQLFFIDGALVGEVSVQAQGNVVAIGNAASGEQPWRFAIDEVRIANDAPVGPQQVCKVLGGTPLGDRCSVFSNNECWLMDPLQRRCSSSVM
jgi:hypothetical protein